MVVGLLFVQRNCHKLDLPTRKCVKIFKKKAQKCQIFSIRNYPNIPKNAYIGCKSPKFFWGRTPGPPLIGRLCLLFCRLAKNPAENPGVLISCLWFCCPEPAERPRLNLKPRSKPIEEAGSADRSSSSAIFGAAKPVDTAAREREIEERRKAAEDQEKDTRRHDEEREQPVGHEERRPSKTTESDSQPPAEGGDGEVDDDNEGWEQVGKHDDRSQRKAKSGRGRGARRPEGRAPSGSDRPGMERGAPRRSSDSDSRRPPRDGNRPPRGRGANSSVSGRREFNRDERPAPARREPSKPAPTAQSEPRVSWSTKWTGIKGWGKATYMTDSFLRSRDLWINGRGSKGQGGMDNMFIEGMGCCEIVQGLQIGWGRIFIFIYSIWLCMKRSTTRRPLR